MSKKASFIICILSILFIAGCSQSNVHMENKEADIEPLVYKEKISAAFTDDRLAGMKGVAQNDHLQLFIDDTKASIAVLNIQTGKIWYSNPEDSETDSIATGVNKALLDSQMQINFNNKFGQSQSVNTYTDSVTEEQYTIETIPNGVKVYYQFGKAAQSTADLPLMFSADRFEELVSKLDKTGQRALKIAYTENDDSTLYERNDSALNGMQLERALKAFEETGYTEEDWEKDMAELNYEEEKAGARIFQAAIEYTLDGDSLVVNVPVSEIQYPEDYPVNLISFMNFFGAGGESEDGSMFVPDGSGALIHFNNGKTQYPAYQQSVYGSDMVISTSVEKTKEEKVRLPVFGVIQENDAILGIIENGSSVARIHADISGRLNSYNYIYPSFQVITKDDVTLQANEQARTLPKFQEEPMKTDYTVRYVFLSGEKASYSGMANYYQSYLQAHHQLPAELVDRGQSKDIPFYLQLVGNISKQKHIAGIPYRAQEPLTTFEQAKTIVNELREQDIQHIKLSYTGWFNKGVNHKVLNKLSVDKEVGGKEGLKEFIKFADENEIAFFPDVSLVEAHSSSGFNKEKEASRTLKGVPALIYKHDMTLNRRDRTKTPSYVVSPKRIGHYTDSMLAELKDYEIKGLALRDLADQLNSDYRKKAQIYRPESEELVIDALNMIKEENYELMASGGNAYAFPYITDIIHAPLSNSEFKLEDETIPFYQMVIRGFIDYSGAPYNLSMHTDPSDYILKCLEFGSSVHFEWIYASNSELKDTEFDHLYSVHYKQWMEQAVEIYDEVNQVLGKVQHTGIESHDILEPGVYKTVYKNGMFVIVNYNQSPVSIEGNEIGAVSYITGGEEV